MKKATSILLALVLALTLAVPAFAGSVGSADNTVEVKGHMVSPTITMTMPIGVMVALNPYRLKYSGASPFLKSLKDSQDQILSVAGVIENKSTSKVSVSAVATATATGFSLVSGGNVDSNGKFAATETTKKAVLKMQLGEATDKDGTYATAPAEAVFTSDKVYYGYKADATVISADSVNAGEMKAVEIAAPDSGANYIAFKFSGAMNDHLARNLKWSDSDTLSISVAFTFKPMANDVAAG